MLGGAHWQGDGGTQRKVCYYDPETTGTIKAKAF
jgi:hypothetical protein